ncbi:unnamed protein product [Hermetia illucens]|uniref:BTB domain-containing protein n=1 Tax=Hermetia illucens TaxID=343691 RepID=A0A7R8YUM1_HERIL|nr:unnamed protein product [Hermetia illucens]
MDSGLSASSKKTVLVRLDQDKPRFSKEFLRYTIKSFDQLCEYPHDRHTYVEYPLQILNRIEGWVRVFPQGRNIADMDWLSLSICLKPKDNVEIYATLEVNIVTLKGVRQVASLTRQFSMMFSSDAMWNTIPLVPTKHVLNPWTGFLLPDGGLKIVSMLRFHLSERVDRRVLRILYQPTWVHIREMLKTGSHNCDLKLFVGGRTFYAHKAVLNCSSTFRGILKDNCKRGVVDLPFMRHYTFEEMLGDCYMRSDRFCQCCFLYHPKKDFDCCKLFRTSRMMYRLASTRFVDIFNLA